MGEVMIELLRNPSFVGPCVVALMGIAYKIYDYIDWKIWMRSQKKSSEINELHEEMVERCSKVGPAFSSQWTPRAGESIDFDTSGIADMTRLFSGTNALKSPKAGNADLEALKARRKELAEEPIHEPLTSLCDIAEEIFADIEKHPEDKKSAKQFLSYYLPTTVKLVNKYLEFCGVKNPSKDVVETKQAIVDKLKSLEVVYKTTLDKLYENDVIDVTADLKVLDSMMAQDRGFVDEWRFEGNG